MPNLSDKNAQTSEFKKRHKLTDKEHAWLISYVQCWNLTEAARQAGYSNPPATGPQMLKKEKLVNALQEYQEQAEAEAIVSFQEAAETLSSMFRNPDYKPADRISAFRELKDMYGWGKDNGQGDTNINNQFILEYHGPRHERTINERGDGSG